MASTATSTATPSRLPLTVSFGSTPQISLLDINESGIDRDRIVSHAVMAIEHFNKARENALNVCLHLYHCREAFRASGDTGWQAFSKANFASLGMGEGQMRTAVRTGRALAVYLAQSGGNSVDQVASLSTMSMSALTVMGDAPEEIRNQLIDAVSKQIEASPRPPTADAVRAQIQALQGEVQELQGQVSTKDDANSRLVTRLQTTESEATTLRNKVTALERQINEAAQRPAVQVMDADPNLRATRDELERMNSELNAAKQRLAEINKQSSEAEEKLTTLKAEGDKKSVAKDYFLELEAAVTAVKVKFTDAMVARIASADPAYGPRLRKLASDLTALGEQLTPRPV